MSPQKKYSTLYYISLISILAPTFVSLLSMLSYPLNICSTSFTMVVPVAVSPARTKAAPPLSSVATTSHPGS